VPPPQIWLVCQAKGALLAPFWKFIIIGFAALGRFLAKLFGKKKDEAI
jgi:uncharacterized membrane-anchored protein